MSARNVIVLRVQMYSCLYFQSQYTVSTWNYLRHGPMLCLIIYSSLMTILHCGTAIVSPRHCLNLFECSVQTIKVWGSPMVLSMLTLICVSIPTIVVNSLAHSPSIRQHASRIIILLRMPIASFCITCTPSSRRPYPGKSRKRVPGYFLEICI